MTQSGSNASVAWQQFLVARTAILNEYERAMVHASEQVVVTHHGVVGEAAVRDWLANFLPRRYGVVSGYIKSQGFETAHQSAHFDVIIYDQLESPVLWTEVNKDKSESGKVRIIPVEFVRAVIEVKSSFCRRTVRDAIAKLNELEPFMSGGDAIGERYPRFLSAQALLAMFFLELRAADASDMEALHLVRGFNPKRAFYGAVILRGDGGQRNNTGIVRKLRSDTAFDKTVSHGELLGGATLAATESIDGQHLSAMLTWADVNFSTFAFDLLAVLNGTYRAGFVSSLHGIDFRSMK